MIANRSSYLPPALETEQKLIGFMVGDVRYGIDIMRIREIVNPTEVVQIPSIESHVIGVTDHRNAVIPIVSLRERFGLDSKGLDNRTKWILVKVENKEIGLQVDRVTQVIKVTNEQRRDRNSLMDDAEKPWIEEVFADDSGLVFVIDLDPVIGPAAQLSVSNNTEDMIRDQ
jgi:purine-binding chemotaxis protein CheW